jgi:hypothetical protein
MGQVIAIQKPIEKLVLEIRGHVHDAGRAENTCAKHQLQAGLRLLELRKRIEAGEAGEVSWWDWFDTQFTGYIKSRKYAEKLMKWARADDPEAAREADYEQQRAAKRAKRARDADGVTGNSKDDEPEEREEYDIVQHALRLVERMNEDQRASFDEAYGRKYR